MTLSHRTILVAILLANIAVSVVLAIVVPQAKIVWFFGAAFLPGVMIAGRIFPSIAKWECAHSVTQSLIGAGVIILVSLMTSGLITTDVLPKVEATRIICVAIGLAVILTGNRLPKMLGPLKSDRANTLRTEQITRQFARIQVAAGAAMVMSALVLPGVSGPYALMACSLVVLIAAFLFRRRMMGEPRVPN